MACVLAFGVWLAAFGAVPEFVLLDACAAGRTSIYAYATDLHACGLAGAQVAEPGGRTSALGGISRITFQMNASSLSQAPRFPWHLATIKWTRQVTSTAHTLVLDVPAWGKRDTTA
jgi:hypothetical protein